MNKKEPILKSILHKQWEKLPEVLKKRYGYRRYSSDVVAMEGEVNIYHSNLLYLFYPFLKLTKTLVPAKEKNVKTTVVVSNRKASKNFTFKRTFYSKNKKTHTFNTKMVPEKGSEIIEFLSFGLGWRHKISFSKDTIKLEHLGYCWKIFGKNIPLPISFLLGKIYAEEKALTVNSFAMIMKITHPLFGKIYEYKGVFEIKNILRKL